MKATPPETRAAIIAALLAGQGVTDVARQFKVSQPTVSRIKASLGESVLHGIESEKRHSIAELVETHLTETLKACAEIARHVTDPKWLAQQGASELAVLFGVFTDKAVRILEAAEAAVDPDDPAAGDVG